MNKKLFIDSSSVQVPVCLRAEPLTPGGFAQMVAMSTFKVKRLALISVKMTSSNKKK